MKFPSKLITTTLFALGLGLASANTMAKTVPVQFKSGASGATYSGKVTGYGFTDYRFYAKKGQILHTKITGNVEPYLMSKALTKSISLDEYSPDLQNGNYILPVTGTYTIRVGQTRAAARQGKAPNYTLQITIR